LLQIPRNGLRTDKQAGSKAHPSDSRQSLTASMQVPCSDGRDKSGHDDGKRQVVERGRQQLEPPLGRCF
jgi:hypothetical protein